MTFYPIHLNLEQKKCLVIGAGRVAERKIKKLLSFGANLTVVGPEAVRDVMILAENKKIIYRKRSFILRDLEKMFLIIAASDNPEVNEKAAKEAIKRNILCNVVDQPGLCNFYVSSIVKRGPLVIGISTGGLAPALSKWMRQRLEKQIGQSYTELAGILGDVRKVLRNSGSDSRKISLIFKKIFGSRIPGLLLRNRKTQAKVLLRTIMERTLQNE